MTTKIIDLLNRSVEFTLLQNNYGYAQIVIDDKAITIYIDISSDKEIDWKDVADFVQDIVGPGRLEEFVTYAEILATAVGQAFFRGCLGEVELYEMQFLNSVYYIGTERNRNGISRGHDWQIHFTYGTPDRSDGDVYGDYSVQFSGPLIVGAKRTWC